MKVMSTTLDGLDNAKHAARSEEMSYLPLAPAKRQIWAKDPLAPEPSPIDVPPPADPERTAPGIPGTSDPEPVGIPDPAPA
jgi:hypothetical protein